MKNKRINIGELLKKQKPIPFGKKESELTELEKAQIKFRSKGKRPLTAIS